MLVSRRTTGVCTIHTRMESGNMARGKEGLMKTNKYAKGKRNRSLDEFVVEESLPRGEKETAQTEIKRTLMNSSGL